MEVLSAKGIMVVKRVAKTANVANKRIDENGNPSRERFVGDLDETVDGNSSAWATLRRGFAEIGD